MEQTTVIQVCVDQQLKTDAETLFQDLGLDLSSAIQLFLKQAVVENSIPYSITQRKDFYNPHNITHLKQALVDLNAGKTERHDLIEV